MARAWSVARLMKTAKKAQRMEKKKAELQRQMDRIDGRLAALLGGKAGGPGRPKGRGPGRPPGKKGKRGRRRLSASARRRIAAAQKRRWAKVRKEKAAKEALTPQ